MRILHLFDQLLEPCDCAGLDQAIEASRRLGPGVEPVLASMGGRVPAWCAVSWPGVHRLGFSARTPLAAVPWLHGLLGRVQCDLVHSWGAVPAAAARLAGVGGGKLLATATRPLLSKSESKWLLSARRDGSLPVVCPTGAIRRDLIEKGHPLDDSSVVRPGVDFGRLRAAKRSEQRERLGLSPEQPVLITCPPVSREGGQYYAIWATALLEQIFADIRLILPGQSKERRRLQRFVRGFAKPYLYLFPDDSTDFVDLLAAADVCVAAAIGPVSTAALSWVMGAGLPVAGSAVPAVTEFLVHDHNALLCKPGRPELLAARIKRLLRDERLAYRLKDTARGQAYQVFSRQRAVDQYRRVYENLLAGRPAFEQIFDAAVDA
jgi:glycosyltransferase involved in cell wall biosynthesis